MTTKYKLWDRQKIMLFMEILSQIDIENLHRDLKSNLLFTHRGTRLMVTSKTEWKEVVYVSFKGLIMIKGNSHTGYQHIRERHNFWTTKSYSTGKEFQAQSKFPQNILPIDFLKLADAIYSKENLFVENKHVDADKFEKYVGQYALDGENLEQLNLILYKDTKIVHSLYPQSNKNNKNRNKKKYPYTRGEVNVSVDKFNRITEIFVPFLDLKMNQKYGLLVDQSIPGDNEVWNILYFNESGKYEYHVEFGIKPKIKFSGDTSARISFQYCDLKIIEDFLIEMDKSHKQK